MIKAVSKRHDHGRRQTPSEAASVKEAARPQIHAFINTLRVKVVRVDAEKVLQLFPILFALFLSVFDVEFEVLKVTSFDNLIWPIAGWLSVIDHLEIGVVKRLGTFKPFVYQIDHYYCAFPVVTSDKKRIMAFENVRDR